MFPFKFYTPCKCSKSTLFSLFCVVSDRLTKEEKGEESCCNYERYRVLVVQKGFHGISEADALAKINVEEMYPEQACEVRTTAVLWPYCFRKCMKKQSYS